jgi:hypothetical protein
MRVILLAIALLTALSLPAQQPAPAPPAGSNWQYVQALPIGTSIYVNAKRRCVSCVLYSVNADSLTCSHGTNITLQRAEIKCINISHRGRSAWIGAAILAAPGIVGVESVWKSRSPDAGPLNRGTAAVVAGTASGIVGGLAGFFTDFTRSTVYKAP